MIKILIENLCLADTSLQRTLFLSPDGVRYREVLLYSRKYSYLAIGDYLPENLYEELHDYLDNEQQLVLSFLFLLTVVLIKKPMNNLTFTGNVPFAKFTLKNEVPWV